MDTAVRTPLEIFSLPQHLVIPLFQRPYVWSQEDQWEPLWADVRHASETRIARPWTSATHFLGAVVLQALDTPSGTLGARLIIDGQQRLTTLQLLLDATAAVLEARGKKDLAAQLEGLAHNASQWVGSGDSLKLRHSNRDAGAFKEVMQAAPPDGYDKLEHAGSLLVRAHRYFAGEVEAWLAASSGDDSPRAVALAGVLANGLQLVVIDLRRDENSQEIFETLNARGTPLTAADLIKNLVFQRLAAEGVDTKSAYETLWPFDTAFWEETTSAGRYQVSRGSLFLNQWLIARTGEEVGPRSTFTRFKHYVEHEADASMRDLLGIIKRQADLYQSWLERADQPHADLTRVELSVYRTQAIESEVIKPLLIWLHEPGRSLEAAVVEEVVVNVESWLLRRALLRLTGADHGRVIAELLVALRSSPPEELGSRTANYFARQSAPSTYWPADGDLRTSLASEPVYRRLKRGRLRMFLEAAEDHLRGYTSGRPSRAGTRVARVGYPIEHLLPQSWRANWPVDDPAHEAERENHVHRLGNLTLLTTSLNSSVSNSAWLGDSGKYAKLHDHDVFLLNRRVRGAGSQGWDEELIDRRTAELVDALVATWPVPEGHVVAFTNAAPAAESASASVGDLLRDGLLQPGQILHARSGIWADKTSTVLDDGQLLVEDQKFTSPSAAGHYIRKANTNGWSFWRLADGRRLKDLRTEYLKRRGGAAPPSDSDISPFTEADLSPLSHRLADLILLANRVSAAASSSQERLLPGATNDPDFLWRRYVAVGSGGTYIAVGVRSPEWGTGGPVWVRLHHSTIGFEAASRALREAGHVVELDASGHAWVPLDLQSEGVADDVVEGVVDQVVGLMAAISTELGEAVDKPGEGVPPDDVNVRGGEAPAKDGLYKAFWIRCSEQLGECQPTWPKPKKVPDYAWLTLPSGTSGAMYYVEFVKQGLLSELVFEFKDAASNVAALDALLEVREIVEDRYGSPLVWESLPGRKSTRVFEALAGATVELEAEWSLYIEWIVDRQTRLRSVVQAVGGVMRQSLG